MTAVQIVALTIGLMALLLLTVVRNDLLAAWFVFLGQKNGVNP